MRRWLEWLRWAPSGRTRFEVWAAQVEGRTLFLEGSGLRWRAALELAQGCRRRRPLAPVLVVDEAGTPVFPARRGDAPWR